MTYTRSGNALATSSTLLKYCTGSFISRSCSSSLNCPKIHDKRKRCETFMLAGCHRGDSIPLSLRPLFFVKGFWSLSLGEKVTTAEGFLQLEYMSKNQLTDENKHTLFFLFHFLFTSRVCYPMTKIKPNGRLSVIWSQSENLLCYKWLLILCFTGITLSLSCN